MYTGVRLDTTCSLLRLRTVYTWREEREGLDPEVLYSALYNSFTSICKRKIIIYNTLLPWETEEIDLYQPNLWPSYRKLKPLNFLSNLKEK